MTTLRMTLIDLIERAGIDHLPTFGGVFEGGYHIQQNPAELADLLRSLQSRAIRSYLQIGSAAGGTERLLCEQLGIRDLTIVDDGQHPKFPVWCDVNRPALEAIGVEVSQLIGDSHASAAKQFLTLSSKTFDLVGIDGDHSSAGVQMDWDLVQPFINSGTLVWLHDISNRFLSPGNNGPKELWKQITTQHRVIMETYEHCGLGIVEIVCPESGIFNERHARDRTPGTALRRANKSYT